ncbi:MAG: hypothetical protein M0C28_16555 [Candidatus Moduliflexus flocculans]|nr:hypothetical protein [Candidatus Moduliflexus flocculans]
MVYLARISGNEKLFKLDLASGQEDAADLRHARRRGGPVHRRRHAHLLVDRHRPEQAGRARSRAQRRRSSTSGRSASRRAN